MNRRLLRAENSVGSEEHLTPPAIISRLGPFDLDPCAAENQPWPTAANMFTKADDGLSKKWFDRVWMNPPYGSQTSKWLRKLSEHGNGIALIYCRTETGYFQDYVLAKADAILFIKGRLVFFGVDGKPIQNKHGDPSSAGASSCLVAYGVDNVSWIRRSGIPGWLVAEFIRQVPDLSWDVRKITPV